MTDSIARVANAGSFFHEVATLNQRGRRSQTHDAKFFDSGDLIAGSRPYHPQPSKERERNLATLKGFPNARGFFPGETSFC